MQKPIQILADARRVVSDPQPGDSPSARAFAWHILKSQRGKTARQCRLPAEPVQEALQ